MKALVDWNFKGSQQNSRSNGARRFVGHWCSLTQVQAVSIAQQKNSKPQSLTFHSPDFQGVLRPQKIDETE